MNQSDWENRYQTGDMPWEKGAPSPGLVDFLSAHPNLPKGMVCVPGCGTGHDVRAWARAGFDTTGYDIAPAPSRPPPNPPKPPASTTPRHQNTLSPPTPLTN